MNGLKSAELLNEYYKCPQCGSDKVGNGAGTFNITETTFTRTCKCGWEVKIVEEPSK